MQGHCTHIAKIVRADLVRVEAEALKAELGYVKAQEFDNLGVGKALCGGGIVGVVSTDWGVRVGPVFPEVEEMPGSGGKGIFVIQVGVLCCGKLSPDKVLLIVKE